MKPPSEGGDAPDEGATAAGYGDTGELTAMSAPFCRCPALPAKVDSRSAASNTVCERAIIGSRRQALFGVPSGQPLPLASARAVEKGRNRR